MDIVRVKTSDCQQRKEFIENMEDIILELSNDDEEVMKKVNDPQFRY